MQRWLVFLLPVVYAASGAREVHAHLGEAARVGGERAGVGLLVNLPQGCVGTWGVLELEDVDVVTRAGRYVDAVVGDRALHLRIAPGGSVTMQKAFLCGVRQEKRKNSEIMTNG